ncbi:Chaperone protein DnaJ, partial [hydrothermal vent metagenome]
DLLCRVVVETPVKLSSKQKDLLHELEGSTKENVKHSPQAHSWLDGVKKFFDGVKF